MQEDDEGMRLVAILRRPELQEPDIPSERGIGVGFCCLVVGLAVSCDKNEKDGQEEPCAGKHSLHNKGF